MRVAGRQDFYGLVGPQVARPLGTEILRTSRGLRSRRRMELRRVRSDCESVRLLNRVTGWRASSLGRSVRRTPAAAVRSQMSEVHLFTRWASLMMHVGKREISAVSLLRAELARVDLQRAELVGTGGMEDDLVVRLLRPLLARLRVGSWLARTVSIHT